MTDQTPTNKEGEDHKVKIVWGILDEPTSPLHGQNWLDCEPLCPCGESHPASTNPHPALMESDSASTESDPASMVDTTLPIRTQSSSNVASSTDDFAAQGYDAGDEVGHSLDVIESSSGRADIKSDPKPSLDKGVAEIEGIKGDKVGSPKFTEYFWGVPIPEGYEFPPNSEASTPILPTTSSFSEGEPRPDRHPARRRPWWSDFQNPKQALETFVRAKETVEYFERIIADGDSLSAKQNMRYLKGTVPQGFALRAKKALEKKYSAVFPSLTEHDGERMAGESLDWMWSEARSTGESLSEEDVILFFNLEALVE